MMSQVSSGAQYLAYRFEGIRYDTGDKFGDPAAKTRADGRLAGKQCKAAIDFVE
jgi:hypothetical protein